MPNIFYLNTAPEAINMAEKDATLQRYLIQAGVEIVDNPYEADGLIFEVTLADNKARREVFDLAHNLGRETLLLSEVARTAKPAKELLEDLKGEETVKIIRRDSPTVGVHRYAHERLYVDIFLRAALRYKTPPFSGDI